MDLNRPCIPRKSKKSPNAYSKDELVDLAVSVLGLKKTEAGKLGKSELCAKLIENKREKRSKRKTSRSPARKRSRSRSPVKRSRPIISEEKICSPRKRAEYPNRWNKAELVQKAIADLGYAKNIAKQIGYEQLCKDLGIEWIDLAPLAKKSVAKRSPVKDGEVRVAQMKVQKKDCVSRSLLPLKKHQERVIEVFNKRRGLIAIHSTGSGKTLTAVTASQCFLDKYPSKRVVVITPTSLQGNFKKELKDYGADITDPRYTFYTYAGFNKAVERKEVDCKDSLLIVDEAHNLRTEIKGEGAKGGLGAKNIIGCAKKAKKVLLLTATPVVNRPYDMANLIAMVDGDEQLTKHFFQKMLEDPDQAYRYFVCKISMFSPEEEEVKRYYPRREDHEVFIPMPPKYLKLYKELEKSEQENNLFIDLFGEDVDLQVFYNGVRRGSNNLDQESSPKVTWIMNKVKDSKKNEKFVIFSHFLEAGLQLLMNVLDKMKVPYRHIDGSMSKSKREVIVDEYNKNKFKVLLISKAGGEGLDLKETRNIIIMEPSWNESTHKQVIGRAIRYKSHETLPEEKRVVDVYRLYLVKPHEEEYMEHILEEGLLIFNKPVEDVPGERLYEKLLKKDDAESLSVDLYLRNFVVQKQEKIDEFLESLKGFTIEENRC